MGVTPATPLHPLITNYLQLANPLHCSGKRYIFWESRFRIGNSPAVKKFVLRAPPANK